MLTFAIILFLMFSALFSGTEIAFVSTNKIWIKLLKDNKGKRAKIISKFYKNPGAFLSTMLVGNNIALVVFTALISSPLDNFILEYFNIKTELFSSITKTLLITLIVLIFGEFFPKSIFKARAKDMLFILAYPLRFLELLMYAPAMFMNRVSNLILKHVLKQPIEQDDMSISKLDLEHFIESTNISDYEDDVDTEIFKNVLHLGEVRIRKCMVPRPEIKSISVNASIEELIQKFQETKHSRLIVIQEDVDDILGYVHHQQVFLKPKNIKDIVMKIQFVPEAMKARELLNYFIKNKNNIVCVVDEFGGVAGIITIEDILEEIFGKIEDEHDEEDQLSTKITENEYLFSGRLEIDELNSEYKNLDFPIGEYTTLSGYLVITLEEIPNEGQEIVLGKYKFIIEKVTDTKIEIVRVIILDSPNEAKD